MVKKRIAIAILSLSLVLVVTYAWINDIKPPSGRYMTFEFDEGKAKTSSLDFDVELYYDVSGNDEYVEMTHVITTDSETPLKPFENFAPGKSQKFRIDITNKGTTTLYLNMLLSDIVCDEALREYIEVGTSGYEGFPATTITPKPYGTTLADGMNEDNNYNLAENVSVPVGEDTVSVYFYVIFSGEATEEFSGSSFEIGSISFMSV